MAFNMGLGAYIEVIDDLVRLLARVAGIALPGLEISPRGSIDERIAKIDAARDNLLEGIKAIDELRAEAEYNKREARDALEKLARLEKDKSSLEEEKKALEQMIGSDVQAFRKMAGVPSPDDIKRERYIGFFSGIIASLIASGVVYLIIALV